MMFNYRYRTALVLVGAVVSMAGLTRGVTVSLKAVKINGVDLKAPTDVIDAEPGDLIETELYFSDWGGEIPGEDPVLKTFQSTIDGRSSFFVNGVNMILPAGYDLPPVVLCMDDADCASAPATPQCVPPFDFCIESCDEVGDDCTETLPDFPVCSPLSPRRCVGVDHAPGDFSFMCTPGDNCGGSVRPDYCHDGFSHLAAASVAGINMPFGSTLLTGVGPVDDGGSCYAGTATLELLPEACGTIEVQLIEGIGESFVELAVPGMSNVTIGANVESLTINVGVACPPPMVVSAVPDHCTVDVRYPHAPDATQPAFWFNEGYDFTLSFDSLPDGGFQQSDFVVTQVPFAPGGPAIDGFSADGTEVTISVHRVPLGPRWMCIEYVPGLPGSKRACWARLSGDVDGDFLTTAADLDALIDALTGIPGGGGLSPEQSDLDRSGQFGPPDLIGWIDLANGAGAFTPALNRSLPACPSQ